MKRLFLFLTVLTLSAALWTQTINDVPYIDANSQPQTADNVNKNGMKHDK